MAYGSIGFYKIIFIQNEWMSMESSWVITHTSLRSVSLSLKEKLFTYRFKEKLLIELFEIEFQSTFYISS